MPSPDLPFRAFDGTPFATVRERRLWNLWLTTVALIIVGSLVAWLLIVRSPVQPSAARAANVPTAQVSPSSSGSAVPPQHASYTRTAPPMAGPGIVWVNTRSKVYHYPGYRWYGTTQAGKFVHEAEAVAEGDRAAMNERRPFGFEAGAQPWRK